MSLRILFINLQREYQILTGRTCVLADEHITSSGFYSSLRTYSVYLADIDFCKT